MPHALEPAMGQLQAWQGAQSRNRLDVFHLCLLEWDADVGLPIHTTVDVGHVTAVLVLVPEERQGGHLVVLPCIDRVDGCLAPVKGLVCRMISWTINEHNEFFILGPDETFPDAAPDELAEGIVI